MERKDILEDFDFTPEKESIKDLLGIKDDDTYVQQENERDEIPLFFNAGQIKALENGSSTRNREIRNVYRKTGKCYFGRRPDC